MKKAKRLLMTLIIITMVLLNTVSVFAVECSSTDQNLIQYYEIDASSLSVDEADKDYIKGKIKVVNEELSDTPRKWTLKIGDTVIGTRTATNYGDPITFSYQPTDRNFYTFTFYTSTGKLTYYHRTNKEYKTTSVINLVIENGAQSIYFIADALHSSYITAQKTGVVKNASGVYDFGTFSYTSYGQNVTFDVKLYANTNRLVINRNGKEYAFTVDATTKEQTIYCEDLVPAQEIHLDYMASNLEKQNFTNAQTVHYSDSSIDNALKNYTITLRNNKTGKTVETKVQSYIGFWNRNEGSETGVGDGTYGDTGSTIKVVCQWDERNTISTCSSINGLYASESDRPFAVYASSEEYKTITTVTDRKTIKSYNNRTWDESGWSSAVSYYGAQSNIDSNYGLLQYRTDEYVWGDYGSWKVRTNEEYRDCEDSISCKLESRTMYAYKTRSWGSWSDYNYTSCSASDTTECRSATRYAKRTRSWGNWSSYQYTGTETLGCSLSDECQRESATRYRKKHGTYSAWSAYTGWQSATCTSTDLKYCESKTDYAYRTIGAWSAWSQTTFNLACSTQYTASGGERNLNFLTRDCKSENQTRYRTRTFTGYSYSNYGAESASKYGSYQAGCTSQNKQSSLCGTTTSNKSCTRYYCATSRTCEKKLFGVCTKWKYSNYKYGYGRKPSPAYDCSQTTVTSSNCGTTTTNKTCNIYKCPSTRTSNYSSWSSWSGWSTDSCSPTTTRECDERTINYQKTRSWNDWTDFIYTTAPVSAATDYRSRTLTRYKTRTLSWSDWTGYLYVDCTPNATTKCESTTLYRTRYVTEWSSWSSYNLTSCTSDTLTDCSNKTMYSKRSLGAWSSSMVGYNTSSGMYTLASCTGSNTVQCYSQNQIRMKYRNPSGIWSSWRSASSLDSISYDDVNYAYQFRYNNGYTVTSDFKGGTRKAVGYYYLISEGASQTKAVNIALTNQTSYATNKRMTKNEINSFAQNIANNAVNSYYLEKAINNSEEGYITWSNYKATIEGKNSNYQVGAAASSKFLNEKRFIPYIFITQHYRAVDAKFMIDGYDDTVDTTSVTKVNRVEESTTSNVQMSAVYVKCCSVYPDGANCTNNICTLYPDSDSCYCQTHPLEHPRCQVDFCADPANASELACACARDPEVCTPSRTDTSVIYYNYLDPLENYTEYTLPANWAGYAALVDEIKNSDLSSYKIQVTLTPEDLEVMRTWVHNNEARVGTGDMIRAFSHIFSSNDPDVSAILGGY